jgi:hypothetical protein
MSPIYLEAITENHQQLTPIEFLGQSISETEIKSYLQQVVQQYIATTSQI